VRGIQAAEIRNKDRFKRQYKELEGGADLRLEQEIWHFRQWIFLVAHLPQSVKILLDYLHIEKL